MGVRHLRHLDLSGVFRKAPKPRRPPVLCPLGHDGQVEGRGAGQDEGRRESKGQSLSRVSRRLGPGLPHHREVQLQSCCSLQRQGFF